MATDLFRFDDYVHGDEGFHVVRKPLGHDRPARMHRHDYFELFLVVEGELLHETRQGEERLGRGDLVLLRPDDAHALSAGTPGCTILNAMFHAGTAAHLAERYRAELAGRFFWHSGAGPLRIALSGARRERLARHMEALRAGPRGLARIERFLLVLTTDLLEEQEGPPGIPPWLARAARAAREPEVFRLGGAGLVSAAGRAHEHVCRQARLHLGMTPTQFVNGIRVEHAAFLLATTGESLEAIAADCGFEGTGHLHRLFRARYGSTPGAFRRRRAADPVQAGGR